jgi:hypothetical protein
MKIIVPSKHRLFLLFFIIFQFTAEIVVVAGSAPQRPSGIISIIDDRSGKYSLKERLNALVKLAENDAPETTAVLTQLQQTWRTASLWADPQQKHLYYALGKLINLRQQNALADSGQ